MLRQGIPKYFPCLFPRPEGNNIGGSSLAFSVEEDGFFEERLLFWGAKMAAVLGVTVLVG
jgi:hypothetical protein